MKVNSTNNINFQAKLNTEFIKNDSAKWKNIATIFEKRTANYPNDELILNGSFANNIVIDFKCNGKLLNTCLFKKDGVQKLFKMNNQTIANKFEKAFNILKREQNIENCANEFAEKIEWNSGKYGNQNEEAFNQIISDIIKIDKTNAFKEDDFLQQNLII